VLEQAGARVVVPPDQVCCGKPVSGAGDRITDRALKARNLAAFKPTGADFIVTFCATCSEHLKAYGEEKNSDEALAFSSRVRDFSEFIVDDLKGRPEFVNKDKKRQRIFYHDPCHLRRKQHIVDQPRALIESMDNVDLVGGNEPPVCCGYGGIFNLWHYDLSLDLFDQRAETIRPYEPDLVATSCSGCWLQLSDGFQKKPGPKVVPLVELLAQQTG
jgi:glycolate oxidase iron-sulfur subunit